MHKDFIFSVSKNAVSITFSCKRSVLQHFRSKCFSLHSVIYPRNLRTILTISLSFARSLSPVKSVFKVSTECTLSSPLLLSLICFRHMSSLTWNIAKPSKWFTFSFILSTTPHRRNHIKGLKWVWSVSLRDMSTPLNLKWIWWTTSDLLI